MTDIAREVTLRFLSQIAGVSSDRFDSPENAATADESTQYMRTALASIGMGFPAFWIETARKIVQDDDGATALMLLRTMLASADRYVTVRKEPLEFTWTDEFFRACDMLGIRSTQMTLDQFRMLWSAMLSAVDK